MFSLFDDDTLTAAVLVSVAQDGPTLSRLPVVKLLHDLSFCDLDGVWRGGDGLCGLRQGLSCGLSCGPPVLLCELCAGWWVCGVLPLSPSGAMSFSSKLGGSQAILPASQCASLLFLSEFAFPQSQCGFLAHL